MAELTTARVVTVVLNWNRRDDTLACLASLVRQTAAGVDHPVLLVDNGSGDGTVDAVRAAYPDVSVLALPENLGFAAGTNAGIREALARGADWVLVLNNDTVADADLLADLWAAAVAGGERVGLLAPTIYFFDPPDRVWPSAGRRRGLTLAPRDTSAHPPGQAPYDVDYANGCCLLVRRAVWEQIGLFDERYRFFYEDHDLCLRARAAGWRILHVPRARLWHRVSASAGQGSALQHYLLARASVPFYWHHTRGLHRAFIVVYRLGSLAHTLLRAARTGRPGLGRAYRRGLVDGLGDLAGRPGRGLDWAIRTYGKGS